MLSSKEKQNPRSSKFFLQNATVRGDFTTILAHTKRLGCIDFSEIRSTLVSDMFIPQMNDKKVKEKLCTESGEPEQALEYAIAFEEREEKSIWHTINGNPEV